MALSSAWSLSAQTAPTATVPVDDDVLNLDAFVISASISPRSKLESSTPVTTIDRGTIQTAAPRSTAEALKLIPGFYVESSGGEANNNLFARGAPSDGGYVYVMLQEDGLPVISESDFSFSPTDNYSRITNWTANIEAVRGGSSAVFQSNAAIGIVNLISREGSDVSQGEVTVQAGDYGLLRSELWTSGPLNDSTTFAIGGFYRLDDGIRSPGYTADKGGQLAANVRHNFANGRGYLKISGKVLDDRTAFQLPIPLANPRNPQTIPGGPDINDGASSSADIRYFSFSDTPLGNIDWDLADGIQVSLGYIGTEFDYELADGIHLTNRNRFTSVDKGWNANPPGSATSLQAIANGIATSGNAGDQFAGAFDATTGNYRYRLTYPGSGDSVAAANAAAATSLNGNGLGMNQSYWHSGAEMENFQNDLRLAGTFGDTTISGGVYYAYLEDERLWQWNSILTDVSNNYRRLDVTYLDPAGNAIGQGTYGGVGQVGTLYRHTSGEEKDTSLYVNLEQKWGALNVDAGVRRQHLDVSGDAEGTRSYDLNQPGETNPALIGATFGNGKYTHSEFDRDATAWTIGANYQLARRTAVFARVSDGYRLPDLDNVYDAALAGDPANREEIVGPTTKIQQYEAGVKYSRSKLAFFLTAFASRVKDQAFSDYIVNPDGSISNPVTRIGVDINGVELEGIWMPVNGLSLEAVYTYQDAKNSTHNFVSGTDASGNPVSVDIHGNEPIRIPQIYGTLKASYRLPEVAWGTPSINASWQYVGRRYTDRANIGQLEGFSEFAAGVSFLTHGGIAFRVQVSNLFNSEGLTEGDPRADQNFANPDQAYSNFRPVLPRSIVASVTYAF